MVRVNLLQFVYSLLEELVIVVVADYVREYGFVLGHQPSQTIIILISQIDWVFSAYENEGRLHSLNTRLGKHQDMSLSVMKKGNEAMQERGTLRNYVRRCWKINDQDHLNISNPFPQTEEDNEESNRLYSQKVMRRQPYSKTLQCWSKSKSTGSVNSHASTEEREEYDREKENIRPNMQFEYFDRQQHEISTCSEEDIEIQEKIEGMSQTKKIKPNDPMIQQQPQREEQQQIIQEEIVEIEDRNQFEANQDLGNLVPFGPPNFSDLSTNYSINSHRQDIDLLDNQPNHIFIENSDNILDHLSQVSTRPCMSHHQESNHSLRPNTRVLTDEDYETIIGRAEATRARWENANINTVSETAINYISTMTRFLEGRENVPLSLSEREQFWSIMAFMRRATSLPQAYLQSLNRFIAQFQQSMTNLQQTYWIEYELIKERTECLNAMTNFARQQRQ